MEGFILDNFPKESRKVWEFISFHLVIFIANNILEILTTVNSKDQVNWSLLMVTYIKENLIRVKYISLFLFQSFQITGVGKLTVPGISTYEGDFLHGKKEFKGKIVFENGDQY